MTETPTQRPYVVFARRWRPQTFDDVVGQDHISQQLKNAVTSGRVGHAFLFRGPRGVGKTSMARILAKALNCEKGPTPEPCGTCPHCRNIASGSAMDVIELDAATHTQVDQMRDLLATVNYAPAAMRNKVYIVDEVHMLSRHAFNALLKTLEEPPGAVKFIFATTDPQRIPETIRSRCQDYEFRRISTDDITQRLDQILTKEGGEAVNPDEKQAILEALARHAEGGMRDAQVALDQLISLTSGQLTLAATQQLLGAIENRLLLDTVRALQANDTARLLEIVEGLVASGADLETFIKSLMQFVRDLLVLRSAPDHANLTDIPSTWMDEIQAILPELELATLLNLGHNLFALTEQMKSVSHTRFLIEFLFIKLTTVKSAAGIDQILKALESGQGLTATSGSAPAAQSQATPRAMGIAPKAAVSADPLAAPPPAVSRVLKPVSTPTDAGTLWKHLTDALWGTDMRMKSLLENGFPLSMEGNVLKVGLPKEDSYYLKRLHKPENTEKITRLLKSLTGADWVVRFVVTDNAPQAPVKVPVQRAEVVARDDAPDELPREEFAPEEDAEPRETRSLPDAEQRINPMRLLDESEYVRHLHTKFQCTGIQVQRPIRGATESNTEEQ